MYFLDYGLGEILLSILSCWVLFLFFFRLIHRYSQGNTWKKDLLISFVQCMVFLFIIIPILNYVL